ncbi:hypothetical protein [Streptomyces sp. NPDC096311]|uniref:hypothetical protein n=1 Tax=Streptomyces sp. NPDC096311 TaxID=3366083 RepID=UPI0038127FF2
MQNLGARRPRTADRRSQWPFPRSSQGVPVAEALAEEPEAAPARVGQLAEPPVPVTADQSLHTLPTAAGTGLPVLDPALSKPVGRLSHQSALRTVHATA